MEGSEIPHDCALQAATLLGVLWMEEEDKNKAAECFMKACAKDPPVSDPC